MTGVNFADFAQWQRDQQAFEAIALYDERAFNVATDDGRRSHGRRRGDRSISSRCSACSRSSAACSR